MSFKIFFRVMKIFECLLIFVLIICSLFIINGFVEKVAVTNEIKEFKDRGEYQFTEIINGQEVKIYKVSPMYDYEDVSRDVFNKVENYGVVNYYLGSKTDITITARNPLRNVSSAVVREFVGFFSNNFYIGHATMNTTDDGSKYIESVGNSFEDNMVREEKNTWINTEVRSGDDTNRFLGLRLKNTTEEIRNEIVEELRTKIGLKYNFNFFVNHPNKYYCTDLLSRSTKKSGIDINYDGFFSIGNDIILSKNTYLIFYVDRIENGLFELYYLG